jgi:hypothetical protein
MASSNRKLIGVGILVAIAGAFLSMITGLFPGLGGGTGEGDGTDPNNVEVNSSADTTDVETVPPAEDLESDGVMDIVIDGETYLVKQTGGTRIKLSLEDIVQRAPDMPGNSDGILVKVGCKRSSVYSAERELKEKLAAAGVSEDKIDWVEETVE